MSGYSSAGQSLSVVDEVYQYITDYGHTDNPEALKKLKEFAKNGNKIADKYLTTFFLWDK